MRVTTKRIRSIFGNAEPFAGEVWETQFDGFNDELADLARTPWDQLPDKNFWVYFHDLTYMPLQPEVFNYLFPACLAMAHQRLIAGLDGCGQGDSDFMRALVKGNWMSACTSEEVAEVHQLLIDSWLDRLELQRGWNEWHTESSNFQDLPMRCNWLRRFNTLGLFLPDIRPLWKAWWSLPHPGAAVAVLEYSLGLAWPESADWSSEIVSPMSIYPYSEFDAQVFDKGWPERILQVLADDLTVDFIVSKAIDAADLLIREPEYEGALQVVEHVEAQGSLIEERIPVLLSNLSDAVRSKPVFVSEWTSPPEPY
jgi:hypothetical protein